MVKIVQLSGGPKANQDQYTGPERELTVDTDADELRLHDGVTQGGHRIPNLATLLTMFVEHSDVIDGIAQLNDTARGFLIRTASAAARTARIQGTDGTIVVTNGDGINADPVIALANPITPTITFSGGVIGNLTGDVTGNLTGNVVGDVVGNLTGNVTGDVTGNLVGSVDVSGGTITFAAGQIPESAVALSANITAGGRVPPGGIIMWSGLISAIPAGWALCDGTQGTPDLRDRFIIGAGGGRLPGDTEGSETHHHDDAVLSADGSHSHVITVTGTALTVAQMPAHFHGSGLAADASGDQSVATRGTQPGVGIATRSFSNSNNPFNEPITETVGGGQTHTHPAASDFSGTHTHALSGTSKNHLPPAYALAFIMKL